MSQRTRARAITAVGAAAVVVALGTVTYNASAAESSSQAQAGVENVRRPGNVPPELVPPEPVQFIGAERVVYGTQTYTCTGGKFTGPSTPEARLVGTLGPVHHFAGPSWQSTRDKSLITATKTAEVPKEGTIAELLLTVKTAEGTGPLAKTKYIQRLQTSDGVAPTRACTDGEKESVRYGATYVFLG